MTEQAFSLILDYELTSPTDQLNKKHEINIIILTKSYLDYENI